MTVPKASVSRKLLWLHSLAVTVQPDASQLCPAIGIFATRIRDQEMSINWPVIRSASKGPHEGS